MRKIFLLLFLFSASCVSPNISINNKNSTLDFNKDLTFNEFNELLNKYVKKSPYPNIDK